MDIFTRTFIEVPLFTKRMVWLLRLKNSILQKSEQFAPKLEWHKLFLPAIWECQKKLWRHGKREEATHRLSFPVDGNSFGAQRTSHLIFYCWITHEAPIQFRLENRRYGSMGIFFVALLLLLQISLTLRKHDTFTAIKILGKKIGGMLLRHWNLSSILDKI